MTYSETQISRRLVTTSEDAGHPLRRNMAPAVLAAITDMSATPKKQSWLTKEDTHLFLLSFVAFFVCFYTFIA